MILSTDGQTDGRADGRTRWNQYTPLSTSLKRGYRSNIINHSRWKPIPELPEPDQNRPSSGRLQGHCPGIEYLMYNEWSPRCNLKLGVIICHPCPIAFERVCQWVVGQVHQDIVEAQHPGIHHQTRSVLHGISCPNLPVSVPFSVVKQCGWYQHRHPLKVRSSTGWPHRPGSTLYNNDSSLVVTATVIGCCGHHLSMATNCSAGFIVVAGRGSTDRSLTTRVDINITMTLYEFQGWF